ncbi:adenylosuccinate lyase [Patescibacteria group bacterium]|nr:MAG: adenylosuccinate lyase [Patescibacteria group bacterium]
MSLTSVSPLDGRYESQTKELSPYFSEMALMKYRVMVEVEYLIALGAEKEIKEVIRFSEKEQKNLRSLYKRFSLAHAERVKEIENTTSHDVKAVEYFIKEKFPSEFIHFALTSEDINNLAYSLMLKDGLEKVIYRAVEQILKALKNLAKANARVPLLAFTHGQPATPTTLGKEMAVFYKRLLRGLNHLKFIKLDGKLNGATGNYAAAALAYPQVDWIKFSQKFVSSLGLNPNLLTTQIEPHDCSAAVYDAIARLNNIIKDLDQDIWLYVSRGIFKLRKKAGEVGSSTMPHKVNPINFENSEGNLGVANAILRFMSDKLVVSRLQRDLTDSTVIRNQGAALGYSLLAYKNTLKGLEKLEVNKKQCEKELDEHWEVLAEAVQTVLRKVGYEKPYEKLKELTRGEKVDKKIMRAFIAGLEISNEEKNKLMKLTPAKYVGLSEKLVKLI